MLVKKRQKNPASPRINATLSVEVRCVYTVHSHPLLIHGLGSRTVCHNALVQKGHN